MINCLTGDIRFQLYDKYVNNKLKSFYQYSDVTEGFKTVYNVELPEMVSEWRNYILRNAE